MNSPAGNEETDSTDFSPGHVKMLSASDLYNINVEVMKGDTLIRDASLLYSAARRPFLILFGEPQFPTIIDKAAALLHSLAYHHLFMDGNKRTAVKAVEKFLAINGFAISWDAKTEYDYLLEIAQGQHEVAQIAEWLAPFIRKRTAPD